MYVFSADVQKAQRWLAELGYNVGKPDGKLGPRTESALETFQREHALARTKQADSATLAKLEEEVKRRAIAAQAAASAAPKAAAVPSDGATSPSRAASVVSAATAPAVIPTPRRIGEPQVIVVKGGPQEDELNAVPKFDNRADVKRIQSALAAAGFYKGEIDGRWGKESLAALNAFQSSQGLKPSTKLDADVWRRLVLAAGPTPTPLPDLLVVAPVSKTLKKARLAAGLEWYAPAPQPLASVPSREDASARKVEQPKSSPTQAPSATAQAMPASSEESANAAHHSSDIRETASTPSAGSKTETAGPSSNREGTPTSAPVPTPAPVGSALDVAAAPAVGFRPNTVAKASDDTPILLPKNPGERTNSTYATAVASAPSRIETVARDTDPGKLLRERPAQTSATATLTDDPAALSERLRAAARQLDQPAAKPKREQAAEKVQACEAVFKELKQRFGGQFKSGAVAEQIASVEAGFKAMKEDFQKGSYDQILARGDGFKRAIEIVTAHAYVASMLAKPDVRAKIPAADLRAIEALRRDAERNPERLDRQEKFLDAAALIRARVGTSGKASAEAKSTSRAKSR
jgi:peptidoglycan hydrolase-like protein with peptidoglycan-binding domain